MTVGVGLTVIVKLMDDPWHPFAVGVTVMVAVTGELPVLTAVNDVIRVDPEAINPIELLSFVQL